MKKQKRIFRQFHYWECDSFAEYLHNMSAKGWHFKGWKLGMIFEKGEPEEIYYDVEAFSKGSEMDTRPEPETEEYADYCEAAGWKFIDSSRRFCVFQRQAEDAVPIVTPEERLQNIKKASWRKWIPEAFTFLFVSANFWVQLFHFNFERYIFWDLMLFFIFAATLGVTEKFVELVFMLVEGHRKKKELAEGGIPFYGGRLQAVLSYFRSYMGIAVVTISLVIACMQESYYIMAILFITALVLLLILAAVALWRPSREDNWMLQLGGGLGILAVMLPVLIAVMISGEDKGRELITDIPLTQADYRSVSGEVEFTDEWHFNGILGEMAAYTVDYKEPTGPWGGNTDRLNYYVYRTDHAWILNRIWDQYLERMKNPEDYTQQWKAQAAVHDHRGGNFYLVLFQEQLLYLYSDEPLEENQIPIICDKLRLGAQ